MLLGLASAATLKQREPEVAAVNKFAIADPKEEKKAAATEAPKAAATETPNAAATGEAKAAAKDESKDDKEAEAEIESLVKNSEPKPAPVLTAENDLATKLSEARKNEGKKEPDAASKEIPAEASVEKKAPANENEAEEQRREYVKDMKNNLARHMEMPPYEDQGDTARIAGGTPPEVSPDEKKAKPEATVQSGGFQLDQRFRLISKREGQKAIFYDPVPISRWDLVNTNQFKLRLEDQNFNGGEYFLWNSNSESIRAFANSGFTVAADKSKNVIIEPFKNADKENQLEYIKEDWQIKNFKTGDCMEANKDDSLKFTTCKAGDVNQQFYPMYTYQVQGSTGWHRLENE